MHYTRLIGLAKQHEALDRNTLGSPAECRLRETPITKMLLLFSHFNRRFEYREGERTLRILDTACIVV
jgi:hypothetical protein